MALLCWQTYEEIKTAVAVVINKCHQEHDVWRIFKEIHFCAIFLLESVKYFYVEARSPVCFQK